MSKVKKFQISADLSKGLEETINVAEDHAGQLRIDVVALRRIELDPENPRNLAIEIKDVSNGGVIAENDMAFEQKKEELEHLRSMAETIKLEGVLNPIMVYQSGDKYRLIAGERRVLASILAGKNNIQAKILEKKPDELKLRFMQWIENIERKDLTLWERLDNLEKIVTNVKNKDNNLKKVTPNMLSQLIGCSVQNAVNYCAVINADESLKLAIKENKIKNLEKAAVIAQIKNLEEKQKAMDVCIGGATLKELKEIANNRSIIKKQEEEKAVQKKLGRPSFKINFGATKKINVARYIINSILKDNKYSSFNSAFVALDWNDYLSVSKFFQQLLQTIEKSE